MGFFSLGEGMHLHSVTFGGYVFASELVSLDSGGVAVGFFLISGLSLARVTLFHSVF